MNELDAIFVALAALLGVGTVAFAFKGRRKKAPQFLPPPPVTPADPRPVLDEAAITVENELDDKVERIHEATTSESPGDDLANLVNARRRDGGSE